MPVLVFVMVVLALIGATLIVARSAIFSQIRSVFKFLKCSQCVGFWIGVSAGASGVIITGHGRLLDALIVGCTTSFLAQLADAVMISLLGEPLDNDLSDGHEDSTKKEDTDAQTPQEPET